jgi:hypothetical protein
VISPFTVHRQNDNLCILIPHGGSLLEEGASTRVVRSAIDAALKAHSIVVLRIEDQETKVIEGSDSDAENQRSGIAGSGRKHTRKDSHSVFQPDEKNHHNAAVVREVGWVKSSSIADVGRPASVTRMLGFNDSVLNIRAYCVSQGSILSNVAP